MRTLIVLGSTLLATPLMAHEGHGGGSPTIHDMEHMWFTLGTVAVLAVGFALFRRFKRAPHHIKADNRNRLT